MRKALLAGVVLASVVLAGCVAVAPVIPPVGYVFNNTVAPLDTNLEKTELGPKMGTASTNCVLNLIAWGDGGIEAAARDGGIKTINHADYQSFTILGIFDTYTTIVYGN